MGEAIMLHPLHPVQNPSSLYYSVKYNFRRVQLPIDVRYKNICILYLTGITLITIKVKTRLLSKLALHYS
jgi:hypothetical protein